MRVMQWNIGGARIRGIDDDPLLQESYYIDSLDYVASVIRSADPDIVTLQETHQAVSGNNNQAEQLANMLGFTYWVNDTHDESHMEAGQLFGQAILSRFEIANHTFKRLPNPGLSFTDEHGSLIHSHNYGLTSITLHTPNGTLSTHTWHLPALHFFGVEPDSPEAQKILEAASDAVATPTVPTVFPGDYNLNVPHALSLLPVLQRKGFIEAENDLPTTPKDKQLDHITYYGLSHVTLSVVKTLADHYALIADFDF